MASTIIPFERIQKIGRNPKKFQELIGESGVFSSIEIDNIEVLYDEITCDYREGRTYRHIRFYPNESGGTNIESEMNWTATAIGIVFVFIAMVGGRDLGAFVVVAALLTVPLIIVLSMALQDQIPSAIKSRIIERIVDIENGEEIS